MSRYDGQERPVPILDVLYPYAGPCAFCGFGDKRHRLADALVGSYQAGDSIDSIIEAYEWPEVVTAEAIETLVAHVEANRRRHKHRWSPSPHRSQTSP